MNNKYAYGMLIGAVALVLAGCNAGNYKPVADMGTLEVALADAEWTGGKIPAGQQCGRFGGKGSTPRLTVSGIPAGANALIIQFSDRGHRSMDNGGHGRIGYEIAKGVGTVEVPPVPGHTFDLPEGFFMVTAHQNPDWDTAGAYMPPCSGGAGHPYYAELKAVYRAPSDGGASLLFAEGEVLMGRY